jgi:hypothetical protein
MAALPRVEKIFCYFRGVARVRNVWKPPPREAVNTLGATENQKLFPYFERSN